MKYLDKSGLEHYNSKIQTQISNVNKKLYSTIAGRNINETTGSIELWSENLNSITTSGFYNAMTCTNAAYPYATLVVIGYYLAGYCTQIITDVTSGNMKKRSQINGSWTAWTDL